MKKGMMISCEDATNLVIRKSQENVEELEKCRPQNHVRALFRVRLCLLHTVKTIGVGVVICFFLIGVLNASETMGLPTNVCLGDFCGPMQKDIWNRFQGATGLKLRLIPSVYSGTCYYDSHAYNPHIPQFGSVLVDKINDNVFFSGKFSFYEQTHFYADLNVETARKRFRKHFGITLYDMFAYAEASDSFAPFRYWFRQEADTNDLLLVGYFGFDYTLLCAMNRN